MLFRDRPAPVLAISQPTHAWISGQLLRAWDEALAEPLLLAAEQHDIGWIDWETAPSFDPDAGRSRRAGSPRRAQAPAAGRAAGTALRVRALAMAVSSRRRHRGGRGAGAAGGGAFRQ